MQNICKYKVSRRHKNIWQNCLQCNKYRTLFLVPGYEPSGIYYVDYSTVPCRIYELSTFYPGTLPILILKNTIFFLKIKVTYVNCVSVGVDPILES